MVLFDIVIVYFNSFIYFHQHKYLKYNVKRTSITRPKLVKPSCEEEKHVLNVGHLLFPPPNYFLHPITIIYLPE